MAVGKDNATIGAIMGVAAVVQVPAAFVAGGLIDRFGGRSIFLVSSAAFLLGAALLASGGASAGGSITLLVAVRMLQGVGLAACMPAVLSMVPGLVRPARLATALSIVQLGANVSLALTPPASLAILQASSLQLLSALVLVTVSAGIVLALPVAAPSAVGPDLGAGAMARRRSGWRTFRPAWRSEWALILGLSLLYVVHWGVITGYLPQRAAAAHADVGFLFTADALSLIVLRLPFAWLADRIGAHILVVCGLAATLAALVVLALPPTTTLLVLAGIGTGGGAALVLPPVTVVLSNRSGDRDRGSAFALFSVAFAVGIAVGSIGLAPFIDAIGFDAALAIGAAAIVAAIALTLADRRLATAVSLPSAA